MNVRTPKNYTPKIHKHPKGGIGVPDTPCERLKASQVYAIIKCILNTGKKGNPKDMPITYSTKIKGEAGEEFVEVRAADYDIGFIVHGGMVTGCYYAQTPKQSRYDINLDGGSPFSQLTIEDRKALTSILAKKEDDFRCELIPAWVLSINGSMPYFAQVHYDQKQGEKAVEDQIKYHKQILASKPKTAIETKRVHGGEIGFKTN